jgi:hypothetical protein
MGRHITGNAAADRIVAGYWLVTEGKASKADVDKVIYEEMRGKSRAEIAEIRDAVEKSM